jgi:Rieske Fe-S protein
VTTPGIHRRQALTGVAGLGIGLPVLAACGGDEQPTAPAGGSQLASTSDIETGGGEVFPDQRVVVTQPSAGEFKAFTAVCTHQGCLVDSVADGRIDCPCHGSQFSIEDGSVLAGPATAPLSEVEITVKGDRISLT